MKILKVLKLDMLLKCRLFVILILIFIFFPLKNTYPNTVLIKDQIAPYCNGVDPDNFLKKRKIENIEIIANKNKKWTQNLLRAIVEFNSENSKTENVKTFNFRIGQKYKKKFNSIVIANFKEKGLSCKFKAKIRMTGDGQWHLSWKNGNPLASVYVQLIDGHINSITRFKLLIPKSRGQTHLSESESKGGENEVFVTSFLRELGFLAPRTYLISAKINGVTENYIFQEDLRKEFLEHFRLKEGPILEGDERFTVMKKDEDKIHGLSLSKLANKNFALKGETNGKIALAAVSNLNLIYLQNHQIENFRKYNPDALQINTEKFFFDKLNKEKFQTYEALLNALDAGHGKSKDDRRFYFDPIKKYYLPIYYDGKSNIINEQDDFDIVTFIDEKKGASKAIRLINSIEHDKFIKKLNESGLNISSNEYKKLIKRIINNLNIIDKSEPLEVKFLKTQKYFSKLTPSVKKNKKLIFVNFEKKEFYFCNFNLDECDVKKNNIVEFKKLLGDILSQKYNESKKKKSPSVEYLFVYNDIEYEKEKNLIYDKWKITKIDEEFIIKYNKNIKLNIFSKKKQINIKQLSNSGRAIITGKKIDGWSIIYNGQKEKIDPTIPSDYLSLTGCLTFLDIQIKNLNIFSKNSTCEDSINFIRVEGNIKTMNVVESFSDAVDFDFSNVKINLIEITSAKNDCLDLSYGNYVIDKIKTQNCGDKAISVGEKSIALLKEVYIDNSNIAVAVKDSSFADINYSEIYNSPICFSAYRKKQEFSGGKIRILKTNCSNEKIFSQKGSKIDLDL